jgi:glycosyltransferase involved in cell wall biosynthesis
MTTMTTTTANEVRGWQPPAVAAVTRPRTPLCHSAHARADISVRRRVLVVSYFFPPVGGAGVQRATKFVKYLPENGWLPSVLTVSNPSVPVFDESLLSDVPQGTIIRRARTLEPSYAIKSKVSAGDQAAAAKGAKLLRSMLTGLARGMVNAVLQPDPQILWMPAAVREGMKLLEEIPHDAILVTGPPFSAFLVGAALSRKSGLPLVLDYRDEWDISNKYWENKRHGAMSLRVQQHMQRSVVRAASALIATTRHSADALREIAKRSQRQPVVKSIYNGFDPDDFETSSHVNGHHNGATDGPFRIAYVGTLWNLTSVEPLVEAVRKLAATNATLASRLELVFAGRRTAGQQQFLDRLRADGPPCRLVEHPYLDHDAALKLVQDADALCVLMSDLPSAERVMPAKVFEYMAARKPVLAIAPRGEVWDVLKDYPARLLLEPRDVDGIARQLAGWIEHRPNPESTCDAFAKWDASPFDRRSQTAALAELLEQVKGGARKRQ